MHKVIAHLDDKPLMVIYTVPTPSTLLPLLQSAKTQLEKYIQSHSDGKSHTWGYFPQYDDGSMNYDACKALNQALLDILKPLNLQTQLAFIRRATQEPESDFGGLHKDVDIGVGHEKDKKLHQNKHILRVLINIGEHPRTLQYIPTSVQELIKQGIQIPEDTYTTIKEDGLDTKTIDIPPISEHISILAFYSDKILHAGKTTSNGHFLAAYGGYVPTDHRLV